LSPVPYEGVSSCACLRFRPVVCLRFQSVVWVRAQSVAWVRCQVNGTVLPRAAARAVMAYFGGRDDGDAGAPAPPAGPPDPALGAADVAALVSGGAATFVAVCAGASPSRPEPLLRVIISVVSCRVHGNCSCVPRRAQGRMPGRAAAAQPQTCRSRLRGDVLWARRICPDSCASPWASLDHNPDPLNGIRTGAIGGPAADLRCAGSKAASDSGTTHRGRRRSRCGESIQTGARPAAD